MLQLPVLCNTGFVLRSPPTHLANPVLQLPLQHRGCVAAPRYARKLGKIQHHRVCAAVCADPATQGVCCDIFLNGFFLQHYFCNVAQHRGCVAASAFAQHRGCVAASAFAQHRGCVAALADPATQGVCWSVPHYFYLLNLGNYPKNHFSIIII